MHSLESTKKKQSSDPYRSAASVNGSKGSLQFKDQRSETVVQRRIQELANQSEQAEGHAVFQRMVSNRIHEKGVIQQKGNQTGLPDQLKSGVESLSGMSMDHVKVHYNSSKPATLQAHAYAQGSQIHLGPGQEKHLPHEAWHVVQQAQGRVKPTMQMRNKVNINDDEGLEKEADVMGAKAMVQKKPIIA